MISTSSYNNFKSDKFRTVSISGNRGIDAGYIGECFPSLAPKKLFWKVWHTMKDVIPDEENNKFYIEEYYKLVLSNLDPQDIFNKLDNSVLLCYEDNDEFCHRHIVAAWLELLLDIDVPEVIASGYEITPTTKPNYIKDYLEKYMKRKINMHGFKSLRAAYIFEKSEKLEEKALQNPDKYDSYMQQASFLRSDADIAEDEYLDKIKQKKILNKTLS